jgi:molybdopterin-guanine dinucleotide biosynthesis protein A
MSNNTKKFSCIILAGGEGKRANGMDKGLISYKNKPLIEHVIDTVSPQVDDIVISANRNFDAYQKYSNNVINDKSDSYRGPMAGIAASLPYCSHDSVLVVACDMPALPSNLVKRLAVAIQNKSISIATVDRHHQLAMIIKKNLLESIQQRLNNNQLKLIQWVESAPYCTINFDDIPQAFINLNKLSDSNSKNS